jgi:hypothetical protein
MEGVEEQGIPNSVRRDLSQHTSAAVLAKALYSASVDDLATARCLEDFQEMRLEPK